jgi:hypothetical protein
MAERHPPEADQMAPAVAEAAAPPALEDLQVLMQAKQAE